MWQLPKLVKEVQSNRQLIWALAIKELRVRYKRSALGFLWALLNPLLMMLILSMVFSTVMPATIHSYPIFLISALLPWTFFSQSLSYACDSIVLNGDLLKKVYVAKSVFPVAAVLSNIINFMFSVVPLVLLLLVFRFPFHITWFYLLIPLISLVLFTLGCSFFFAMANVFFRDMAHILQVLLSAWFYLCPIIYSLDFVPARYRTLFRFNPMVYPLNGFRLAIYYGLLPSPQSTVLSLAVGLAALLIGYGLFRRYQDTLVFYV
jgi:ABC-2 type transport system permease protein